MTNFDRQHRFNHAAKDDEVRKSGQIRRFSVPAEWIIHDEERARAAMGIFPSSGVGQASQSGVDFRRTEADRRPARSVVTDIYYPLPYPGKPHAGSSTDAILAWNEYVKTVEPKQRWAFMELAPHLRILTY